MTEYNIRPFEARDYDDAIALWQGVEGVGLSSADSRERIQAYLERNPGMSFTAWSEAGELIGAVLCGHDGRRGYLHHMAVRSTWRGKGVGKALADTCMTALEGAGIDKCHLFVMAENRRAVGFWRHIAWQQRDDIIMMSSGTKGGC